MRINTLPQIGFRRVKHMNVLFLVFLLPSSGARNAAKQVFMGLFHLSSNISKMNREIADKATLSVPVHCESR